MSKKYLWLATLIALLAGPALQPAAAVTVPLSVTGSGSDGALAASATFTTGAGTLSITLSNTLTVSQIVSAGQALSDLQFTLSNPFGTIGTLTASGQLANIGAGGTVTNGPGAPVRRIGQGPPPPGGSGTFATLGTSTIVLEAIGGGQPSQMILPSGGPFTNGNASITDGKFSPFVDGPVTIVLALSGVTANTTVLGARFSFGTGPDTFLQVGTVVPLPGALPLFATGLVGLGLLGRRRMKKAA